LGYVQSKAYKTHPGNINNLKWWIQERIQGNPKEMLCVMTVFPSWPQECTEQHGGHLQSVILKD
jgi:hypothetical protein